MTEVKIILFAYFTWLVGQRVSMYVPIERLPGWLVKFIRCPYCSGFWLSIISLVFFAGFRGVDWVWASGVWAVTAIIFSLYKHDENLYWE